MKSHDHMSQKISIVETYKGSLELETEARDQRRAPQKQTRSSIIKPLPLLSFSQNSKDQTIAISLKLTQHNNFHVDFSLIFSVLNEEERSFYIGTIKREGLQERPIETSSPKIIIWRGGSQLDSVGIDSRSFETSEPTSLMKIVENPW